MLRSRKVGRYMVRIAFVILLLNAIFKWIPEEWSPEKIAIIVIELKSQVLMFFCSRDQLTMEYLVSSVRDCMSISLGRSLRTFFSNS